MLPLPRLDFTGKPDVLDNLPVRFGERWAETYTSNGATRRPSTLSARLG